MVLSLYLIGYVHSSDRYCAGEYMGEYRDSLDAATSACNKNIECNCFNTCFHMVIVCLKGLQRIRLLTAWKLG